MSRTRRNHHLRFLSDEGDPQRFRVRVREARRELSDAEAIDDQLDTNPWPPGTHSHRVWEAQRK